MKELTLVTENGEKHGMINQIVNSVTDENLDRMKPKDKEKALKQKKEDQRMVKARYINYNGDHERLECPYMRWAGEPIRHYRLIPNQVYTLPMGFVDEINRSYLTERSNEDDDRTPIGKIIGKKKVHELVPVGF